MDQAVYPTEKFNDPDITADGRERASVRLTRLDTLWFNTGTLCNLECGHCYIESSPRNDSLVYISTQEVATFLDEAEALGMAPREVGLTGGEPFMNPDILAIIETVLARGYRVLVLTNAMRPMMKCAAALLSLRERYGDRVAVRVSVDHYSQAGHEGERGPYSWSRMLQGLKFLSENDFCLSVAGRTFADETEASLRSGYRALFKAEGIAMDADDPTALMLFPEMDAAAPVPEITTECWGILGIDPDDVMCASSRMVVKRKGAAAPTVAACTLLPYEAEFDLGPSLAGARGSVKLNHPHCAKFCVLGGGSCSL